MKLDKSQVNAAAESMLRLHNSGKDLSEYDFCERCECVDPYPYCTYLPVMKIWVDDPGITMQEFEVIEDAIAKAIGELGYAGRIESYTTGNTTTFPLVEQEE